MTVTCGIDWAVGHHDVAVVGQDGRKVAKLRISDDPADTGWNGPTVIDDGVTESMAPATDIADTDAVTALQAVTDTEGGVMFADAGGNMVFHKRTRRWSPAPATVVFGENAAGGEWPYEDQPVLDYDPTLVTNLAEVTHSGSGVVYTARDFPSQTLNGVRDRQVISQASSTQECQDKAQFLVVRYKVPRKRVASMTLVPSANPAMWRVLLGLDIGSRAKAIHRPAPPAATVTVDGFVENLGWAVDVTSDAALTVQISPADPTPYGVFDTARFGTFVFGY